MNQRGDTLIEVMFSAAVLALLIVLSIGIMNGGTAQSERSVEGTFVRQSIDSQTELLRYARDSYVNKDDGGADLWNTIKGQEIPTPMNFTSLAANCLPQAGHKAFWMTADGGAVTAVTATPVASPDTYAAPGHGMWIEATPQSNTANYIDFYIYACWDSPSNGPKATTGTIVRLYAPAS